MIGYCVPAIQGLASYRFRVALPAPYVGPHVIGGVGDITFFFKGGNPALARKLDCPIVYDVVNAHFDDPDYRAMCDLASVITCSSGAMARTIKEKMGRDAVVISDPYENKESKPEVRGGILWFGHQANIASLIPYADLHPETCTGGVWSLESEAAALASAGVVLLTASNPGASSNRPVKAIRAGRFVVAPEGSPESWNELADFMWIGDVRDGIRWAFANREEACFKVSMGQAYVRNRFSPRSIGSQWADLFASILALDTKKKMGGSVLTSP